MEERKRQSGPPRLVVWASFPAPVAYDDKKMKNKKGVSSRKSETRWTKKGPQENPPRWVSITLKKERSKRHNLVEESDDGKKRNEKP